MDTAFAFSSPTAGTATVTAVATNSSGTEITRGVSSTIFTTAASPSPSPTSSPTPSPSASPEPGATVSINGGDRQAPVLNAVFTITGTAPAGSTVSLRFRKAGSPAGDFSLVRTVTATADGTWRRDITASVDYVYYATIVIDGALIRSGTLLNQPTPIVNGPTTVTTLRNRSVTITGQAAPLSTVFLHFHKAGTPASDYSIVRPVSVSSTGQWQRALLANVDYRFYVSRAAGDSAAGRTLYLIKTR